ncbi:hypothetical protein EC988_009849, partial [Linderina pennispora]
MKFSSAIATISVILGASVLVQAMPAYEWSKYESYDQCVKAHDGKVSWPYPGPGDCHNVGTCECLPGGN